MVLVKRSSGILSRLQECKLILLSLITITLLHAIPELAIRSTISDISQGYSFCILTTHHHSYGLYVAFKLIIRHLLPAICVLLCLLCPCQPAVCECGPSGAVLARPHECPKMTRSRP